MSWLPRETVVVPIDFSDDSFAAIDVALEMGDDPARLHVVHVLPILEANDPGVIWHLIDDESRSEHAAQALKKGLADRGHQRSQVTICFGDPGHEIAQYAEQIDAGLIVVASHGKSGFTRLLIGSVADRVVRLAHCAVLVLKR